VRFVATLFTGVEQDENFGRVAEYFPVSTMTRSPEPFDFADGPALALPASFTYAGHEYDTERFLSDTDTTALLVLQDGAVRYERYIRTGGRDVHWLSMSVAKSFVSAALGIAVAEGLIGSVEEPITSYLPELAGSAYDGVRIKDVLQMSSGARWDENYNDPSSDINRLGRILAIGGSLDAFLQGMVREREPGTYNLYDSADTQALGALLVRVTGRPIADYMQEKLWHPLGMEADGYWIVDDEGMELAFAGLNATARDYAKLGELYRNLGSWQGRQIVPRAWVVASVTPDAPHLLPGDNPASDFPLGYGYQWWVMDGEEGEYSAIGVLNQFIYVNPSRRLVIVKLSANSDYGTTPDGSLDRELETIELFRAIGNAALPSGGEDD
jgi:CubicO group peptidase (beta-lactamase class C family)